MLDTRKDFRWAWAESSRVTHSLASGGGPERWKKAVRSRRTGEVMMEECKRMWPVLLWEAGWNVESQGRNPQELRLER